MPSPAFIADRRVEHLDFEATDTGFRRVSRETNVVDCETHIDAKYDERSRCIVVTERELLAFQTGVPVESVRRRLALTLDEAQALNARLSRLLADVQSGEA